MKQKELTLNCDGVCGQRTELKNLLVLSLINNKEIFICKTCLRLSRPLKIEDIEYY